LVGFLFFLLAQFSAFWLRSAMKTPSGRLLALFAFFFAANMAQAAPGAVDFSSYDVPLYEQIVNRIKAKVSARLGETRSTRDRYFIIPFAYQDRGNHPENVTSRPKRALLRPL
jgi:hypothetical protein